jgi:rhamnosyl/mannosyltransferase
MEKVVQQLGEGLAARGHSCSILACGPENSIERYNEVTIHRLKTSFYLSSAPFSFAFPAAYRRLARKHDTVIHHYPNPTGELAELAAPVQTPKVVLYHSDLVRQKLLKPLYDQESHLFLRRARAIVCTSPNYAKTSPLLRRFAQRLQVIPLSVDTAFFQPTGAIHPMLQALRSEGTRIVLYVGRFCYYKGLEFLIRAAALLPDEVKIVLIGKGEEEDRLIAMTQELRLDERLLFLPPVTDEELHSLYRGADLFVLPSIARSEAFGLVAIEAMACGTPLVTTEIGTGTTFHNVSGITGLVVPPSDPKALAEAIQQILQNETRRAEMGKNAADRAKAEFSRAVFLDRWEHLLLEEV